MMVSALKDIHNNKEEQLEKAAEPISDQEKENDMDDEDEEDEEVYIVEAILEHKKDRKGLKYLIKWQGFSDADNTWEAEENILSKDLLDAYWAGKNKGKDGSSKTTANKKRKLKADNEKNIEPEIQEIVLDHTYPPPELEDWESQVLEIETVEKNSKGELTIYVLWKNGCHTAHAAEIINKKCPQKVIEFYTNHLKFADE